MPSTSWQTNESRPAQPSMEVVGVVHKGLSDWPYYSGRLEEGLGQKRRAHRLEEPGFVLDRDLDEDAGVREGAPPCREGLSQVELAAI